MSFIANDWIFLFPKKYKRAIEKDLEVSEFLPDLFKLCDMFKKAVGKRLYAYISFVLVY